MKKFVSFVCIACFLISSCFVFACKKDSGYNLDNLKSQFFEISTKYQRVELKDNKFVFKFGEDGSQVVENLIANSDSRYHNLTSYNTVLDNSLDFAYKYIDYCSNNSLAVDKDYKNQIESSLKELDSSFDVIDRAIGEFSHIVKTFEHDPNNERCLQSYKNLLNCYEMLFFDAVDLSTKLCNIYFEYYLTDQNPDYCKMSITNFEQDVVVARLKPRISYQIVELTRNFVETYLDGGNVSDLVANKGLEFDINFNNYSTNVKMINVNIDVDVAIAKAQTKRDKVFNKSKEMYVAQSRLNNDSDKFNKAYSDIKYADVIADSEATSYQKECVEIINSHTSWLGDYSVVLSDMLEILEVK